MLTRFVRTQLIIFGIASVIGIIVMVFVYVQAPTLLGVGRITVKMELPHSGGLYRFSNVTLRGVQIGKVTAVDYTRAGAEATLSLDNSPRIPSDLQAQVRSVSAVGEQYVDLLPRTDSQPYLRDGSVIAAKDTTVPQQVGPVLDQVSALVQSIPKDKLSTLLDESFKGLNGSGQDFGSLIDSTIRISGDLNSVTDQSQSLIEDAAPLLDSQADAADSIRTWARNLAGVTGQVAANDPQVRSILSTGPSFAQEVSRLLSEVKPTLPILLANLTTVGQIGVTYNPSLEQLLVLLPPYVAAIESYGSGKNNPTGSPLAEFSLTLNDPPGCTVGFLPPSQWRSPAETTTVDTPEGLYCKLPQDSPISVRGARNYPCMGHPGKRAPTVEICDSEQPFIPIAQREHALGPYPIDPNLLAKGIPPDARVNSDTDGPIEGTPLPQGISSPSVPAEAGPPGGDTSTVAPSGFHVTDAPSGPSVATAQYDPNSGRYVRPDGAVYTQTDLSTTHRASTWKDLVFTEH